MSEFPTREEIDAHLVPIREDIHELKDEQKEMRVEMRQGFKDIADSQWLGPQGRTFISGAGLVGAVVALAVALLNLH